MKNKKTNKIFKTIFFTFFLIYLTFFIAQNQGYYEYRERKKMTFTKEQIEKYEQDIKEGKNIDIINYLENPAKNYQNKISKTTLNISENISKYTKKGISVIFNKIGNVIE